MKKRPVKNKSLKKMTIEKLMQTEAGFSAVSESMKTTMWNGWKKKSARQNKSNE